MSYRNDHDAALARMAALEAELTALRTENARLRGESESPRAWPPPPSANVELYGEPAPSAQPTNWGRLASVALRLLAFVLLVWRLR